MPPKNGNGNGNENIAGALADISDRLTRLVQDEIELAKAEVSQKAMSLARGAAALAAGAVFGIFAVVFLLLTLAWVFDGIFVSGAGSLWLGFLIVLVILLVLTVAAALFAWRAFSVGAPTPKMAIDEGKKIKDTVATFGAGQAGRNGGSAKTSGDLPSRSFAAVAAPSAAPAVAAAGTAPAVPAPAVAAPAAPAPAVTTAETAPAVAAPAVPAPAVTAAETAPAPAPATTDDAEPAFVSVPGVSPTTERAPDPDPPTLIADQEPEAAAGEEPDYEIQQVQDDDGTGPENH